METLSTEFPFFSSNVMVSFFKIAAEIKNDAAGDDRIISGIADPIKSNENEAVFIFTKDILKQKKKSPQKHGSSIDHYLTPNYKGFCSSHVSVISLQQIFMDLSSKRWNSSTRLNPVECLFTRPPLLTQPRSAEKMFIWDLTVMSGQTARSKKT